MGLLDKVLYTVCGLGAAVSVFALVLCAAALAEAIGGL